MKQEYKNVTVVADEAARLLRDNPEWTYKKAIEEAKRLLMNDRRGSNDRERL